MVSFAHTSQRLTCTHLNMTHCTCIHLSVELFRDFFNRTAHLSLTHFLLQFDCVHIFLSKKKPVSSSTNSGNNNNNNNSNNKVYLTQITLPYTPTPTHAHSLTCTQVEASTVSGSTAFESVFGSAPISLSNVALTDKDKETA